MGTTEEFSKFPLHIKYLRYKISEGTPKVLGFYLPYFKGPLNIVANP